MNPALDQKGVLHIPLALLAILIALTGLALWGLLHHWKSLTRTQLRLDQCTGEAALELKSKLTRVTRINGQMEKLRALEAAAATVNPAAQTALFAAVNAEAVRQEAVRAEWLLKRGKWAAQTPLGSNCGSRGDVSAPLPALEWTRDLPDELGAKPLRLEELPPSFYFEVRHSPRDSAAEVYRGGPHESFPYHARWVAPRELLRPSLY